VAAAVLALLPPHLWGRAKAAAAYAGLIPEREESGKSVERSRLSRKGPPLLRRRLFMGALVAVRHDPEMRAFYERLLSRGKRKKQALVAEFREGVWRLRKREEGDGEVHIRPPRAPKLAENQAFEGAVLGYAKEARKLDLYRDPFRAVRLSDSSPGEGFLNRIGVFHPRKDTTGLALLAETFRKGSRFTLSFRYHGGLSQHRGVSMPIPPEALRRALRKYYTRVAKGEQGFAKEHQLKNAVKLYEELFQRLEDPEVFPIRVGFGSGRLSLRLALLLPEDHPEGQEPKTRKTAGSREPQDGFPLGWMVGRLVG